MTKMDKEMIKQMEQFQKDYPDATAKEKRDFLEFLSLCSLFEITEDDPLGILSYEGKFGKLNNEYEHAKFIEKLNNKKHWETDADVTIKDLLYRYAIEELSKQHIDIPADIAEEWNEENEAYREWCNKAHTSPKTASKPVREQYVYISKLDSEDSDTNGKWYRVTETGHLEEAPDYIPPDNTK